MPKDNLIERLREFTLMLIHADGLSMKPAAPNQVETTKITTRESQMLRAALIEAAGEIARLRAENVDLKIAVEGCREHEGMANEKALQLLGALTRKQALIEAARADALEEAAKVADELGGVRERRPLREGNDGEARFQRRNRAQHVRAATIATAIRSLITKATEGDCGL